MSTLPSTRTLLTSLFNTLTEASTQQVPQDAIINEPYDPPSNPLKTLSPSHRKLLSTMHVLFTPPMLLQALDLLDRGLVVRVVEQSSGSVRDLQTQSQAQENGQATLQHSSGSHQGIGHKDGTTTTTSARGEVFPPQANIHIPSSAPDIPQPAPTSQSHHQESPLPSSRPKTSYQPRIKNTFYQVRSSQPPKSRFRDATSATANSGTNIYTVRLEAWNCSCAAFAFACFPASSVYPSRSPWDSDSNPNEDENEDEDGYERIDEQNAGFGEKRGGGGRNEDVRDGEGEEKWEFGGMSRDGKGAGGKGGSVPCCKHLLACALGERWDVLRGYVEERVVSREEMAGLGSE